MHDYSGKDLCPVRLRGAVSPRKCDESIVPGYPFCTKHLCRYSGWECQDQAVHGHKFCNAHLCSWGKEDQNNRCGAERKRIYFFKKEYSETIDWFCDQHQCKGDECLAKVDTRNNPNALYCFRHTCLWSSQPPCTNFRHVNNGAEYCPDHRCLYSFKEKQHGPCHKPRESDQSERCEVHANIGRVCPSCERGRMVEPRSNEEVESRYCERCKCEDGS